MTQPPLPPPRQSKTILGNLSQSVKTAFTRINFSKLQLRPNARVPELWVQDSDASSGEMFPLLGDRYLLGRSGKNCDIVVRNPVVSQVHAVLKRDRKRKFLGLPTRSRFMIRDEGSTNGIYRGKRKLKAKILYDGDVISLGPPELAAAVQLRYKDPLPWYLKGMRYGLFGVAGVTTLAVAFLAFQWQRFSVYPLPPSVQGPTVVLSSDGQPLKQPRTQRHTEANSLQDYSDLLPKAVMASEDTRYYWHVGVDPIGTVRALVTNVKEGEIREGASTVTQQLARNLFRDYVGSQDSAGRKLREAIVALKLEAVYSKDQIMLTYLNRVFLGNGIYGFEDAAQFYFGKSAKQLSLNEVATLVGILPAPNSFNPVRNYKAAVDYRNRVIARMAEQGMVSSQEADTARRSRIEITPSARQELASAVAPYFYDHVYSELDALLGDVAREGNFIVETGLDRRAQARAEASLRNTVSTQGASAGFTQGSLVTIDASTGEVIAMVGGVDYQESQFNRVTQALRQPGSTFKIFSYASAIEQGIPPGTGFSCAPLNWGGQDFAGCRAGGGSVDMFVGMAQSENVIALRIAQQAGLDKVAQMARRMGVTAKLTEVPGLVLGQSEATPLEMTGAFGVLANQGVLNRPHVIKRVLDSSQCQNRQDRSTCREIYNATKDSNNNQQVISADLANTMTTLLQGVVRGGTGRAAAIGQGEAGKTGTTNDNVDLWYIGYVPNQRLVTGIWLGNDNNSSTGGNSGLAAQLWGDYMRQIGR